MVGGAVEAEVDTEGDGRPRRVVGAAVKANLFLISHAQRIYSTLAVDGYLIRRLCLQFLEDLLRLSFRCGAHLERPVHSLWLGQRVEKLKYQISVSENCQGFTSIIMLSMKQAGRAHFRTA